jgi:hypothetical protein
MRHPEAEIETAIEAAKSRSGGRGARSEEREAGSGKQRIDKTSGVVGRVARRID